MSDKCIATQPTLPIFREIVEALDEIIGALDENSNVIYSKVNLIREKTEPENEKVKPNNQVTVVDELWQKISELRDVNYTLCITRENLQDLVG